MTAARHTIFTAYQHQANKALDRFLPNADKPPARLHAAMRYASLLGGKRVRPAFCYSAGEIFGFPMSQLDAPACAVECIHAYSLVHDDLPAMDDDNLRRGQQTCHREFDEATAILVGDALQSLAFQILAEDTDMAVNAKCRLKLIQELAHSSGSTGMVGGQAMDLAMEQQTPELIELESLHLRKTGKLIRASLLFPAIIAQSLGKADTTMLNRLDHAGKCIGLAFQIQDDILDEESSTEVLGKQVGADRSREKATYPALLGLSGAKQQLSNLHQNAMDSINDFGSSANNLREVFSALLSRTH